MDEKNILDLDRNQVVSELLYHYQTLDKDGLDDFIYRTLKRVPHLDLYALLIETVHKKHEKENAL